MSHSSGLVVPSDPAQSPALLGAKCSACGTVVFPKMPVCPSCGRNDTMRDAEIGRKGHLFSHTIARFAPKGFKAPFFQAFIDLDEGPRIFSLIGAQCPVEDGVLADGMVMRLVIEPLAETPENKDILSYKYVPAEGGNGHA
ncbi:MAG: Zn-ribbon domain-containing OB-fold protein [Xanthobacteraceae bacterium]